VRKRDREVGRKRNGEDRLPDPVGEQSAPLTGDVDHGPLPIDEEKRRGQEERSQHREQAGQEGATLEPGGDPVQETLGAPRRGDLLRPAPELRKRQGKRENERHVLARAREPDHRSGEDRVPRRASLGQPQQRECGEQNEENREEIGVADVL